MTKVLTAYDSVKFPFLISGKELEEMPIVPPEWIIPNYVQVNERRMSLLCGQPDAGKSTLAIQMAAAVLMGGTVLGEQTTQCDVLYWQTECQSNNIKRSLERLGYDSKRDAHIEVFNEMPRFNTLENMRKVLDAYKDIRFVIIETIDGLLHFKDILANSYVKESFDRFDNVMGELFGRVGFLGLAQLNKSQMDKKSGSLVLGASEIIARTGIKMYLRTGKDEDPIRRFHSTVREDGIARTPINLRFDPTTRKSTFGDTAEEELKGVAINTDARIESEFITYATNHPNALYEDVWASAADVSAKTRTRLLKKLDREDRIQITGKKGVKGAPRRVNVAGIPKEENNTANDKLPTFAAQIGEVIQ